MNRVIVSRDGLRLELHQSLSVPREQGKPGPRSLPTRLDAYRLKDENRVLISIGRSRYESIELTPMEAHEFGRKLLALAERIDPLAVLFV